MKNKIDLAENFGNSLEELKKQAPPVGTAALNGRSQNRYLRRSWNILNSSGVSLERSNLNYHWRQIHNVDPKLGHAIEEVLVFGESLFSAWGKLTSPESLSEDYLDLKQRFSKIVKETTGIVAPEEEKKSAFSFSFFSSSSKKEEEPQMEERLDHLDDLLEKAHFKSRRLLQRAEVDLASEKAFHRAIEWYVLALEGAKRDLDKLIKSPKAENVPQDVFLDLQNALLTTTTTTSASLGSAENVLKKKEELHNQSIMFLTAHENTFTVIQGHLRSWKNIKTQTDALNGLSQTVNAGMKIMDSASVGVEAGMKGWDYSLVTPEAMKKLADSFGQYDERVTELVTDLTKKDVLNKPSAKITKWEDWTNLKKDLLSEILDKIPEEDEEINDKNISRPTLRKREEEKVKEESIDKDENKVKTDKKTKEKESKILIGSSTPQSWSRMDLMVTKSAINEYNRKFAANLTQEYLSQKGWSAMDTLTMLNTALNLGVDKSKLPTVIRNLIDQKVQEGDMYFDFESAANLKVLEFSSDNLVENLKDVSSSLDDLDWANFMQWNDLIYDLLICESDIEQKNAVLSGKGKENENIRQGLIDRISAFVKSPGISEDKIKQWGMSGLITRYAIALDMGENVVDKLWSYWHNPAQPVDWDGTLVRDWVNNHQDDISTPTGQKVWDKFNMNDALYRPTVDGVNYITGEKFSGISNMSLDLSEDLANHDISKAIKNKKSRTKPKANKSKIKV